MVLCSFAGEGNRLTTLGPTKAVISQELPCKLLLVKYDPVAFVCEHRSPMHAVGVDVLGTGVAGYIQRQPGSLNWDTRLHVWMIVTVASALGRDVLLAAIATSILSRSTLGPRRWTDADWQHREPLSGIPS